MLLLKFGILSIGNICLPKIIIWSENKPFQAVLDQSSGEEGINIGSPKDHQLTITIPPLLKTKIPL